MCNNVCIEVNEIVENISIEVRDFSVLNIISQDAGNSAVVGSDGLLFVTPSGGGGVTNHSELNLDDGTNPHGTTKTDVGLGNVDNTSDVDKPISNAVQLALNNKQDNLTDVNFGTFSESLTEKTTIVDADKFNITDSEDSNKQKKFTFANLKTTLTTFFNGLFVKVNLDPATTPLDPLDKAIVFQSGIPKEVAVSELGGSSLRTETYVFVVTSASTFPAFAGFYSPRDNVANGIFNPLWEIGLYDGTSGVTRTRMGRRIVKYNQKATEIAISYSTLTVDTKIRFIYYEINPSGTSTVGINNHTIHEVTIPANTGPSAGVVQPTLFITPVDFTMSKGGMISMVINNNNLALTFKDFIAEVRVKKV